MNPVLILPAFYANTSLGDFDRKSNSPFIIIRLALSSMCSSFFPWKFPFYVKGTCKETIVFLKRLNKQNSTRKPDFTVSELTLFPKKIALIITGTWKLPFITDERSW